MGLRLPVVFHTSRAKRVFCFAENVLSPRAPDATWPKCSAQLGWRREFHVLVIQLGTFWPDSFASPPPHPTFAMVSKVRILVGSAATDARSPPNLHGPTARRSTMIQLVGALHMRIGFGSVATQPTSRNPGQMSQKELPRVHKDANI